MEASVLNYPKVRDEFVTLAQLQAGASLSRVGDGEAKMACGFGYSRQLPSEAIAAELSAILSTPQDGLLVGIPTLDRRGPKYQNWTRHEERIAGLLSPDMRYYSAFISRPDSAPWISSRWFAEQVQSLWAGKRATVVCQPHGSMLSLVSATASVVHWVGCPTHQAYDHIDQLEARVLNHVCDVAILSAGPTATCLAARLARKGVHAIDLGSAAGYLRKLLATNDEGTPE